MPLLPRSFRRAAFSLALCAASVLPARAQGLAAAPAQATLAPSLARLDQILPSLNRGISIGEVAISPDGKRIAWFQRGEIRIAPLNNLGQSPLVTAASPNQSCTEHDFAWSPDSAALVFLSDCAQSRRTTRPLSSLRLDGIPARRFTDLHGYVDAARLFPRRRPHRLPLCGRSHPPRRSPRRRERRPPASSAKTMSRSSASPSPPPTAHARRPRPCHARPISTSSSSTGRPTPNPSPTSPPTLPAKTTGGSPASTRNLGCPGLASETRDST